MIEIKNLNTFSEPIKVKQFKEIYYGKLNFGEDIYVILEKTDLKVCDIRRGYEYMHFLIDGIIYSAYYTNKIQIESLLTKTQIKQLSIFDF